MPTQLKQWASLFRKREAQMKLFMLEVEGRPEEIAAIPQLAARLGDATTSVAASRDNEDPAEAELVELITRVLLRRSESGVMPVLRDLYQQNDFCSRSVLESRYGRGIDGILGALGNRCAHTDGWPPKARAGRPKDILFEIRRIDGVLHYKLRAVTRRAIELARLV